MLKGLISKLARIENHPWVAARVFTRAMQITCDATVAAFAFVAAHVLRLDGWPVAFEARRMLLVLPFVVFGTVFANSSMQTYRRVWRYASISDALRLAVASGIVSGVLLFLRLVLASSEPLLAVPIGVVLIHFFMVVLGMVSVRLVRRLTYEATKRAVIDKAHSSHRVLLVGAGDAGIMTAREITRRRDLGIEICGFVDDDQSKLGAMIHDIPVLAKTAELPAVVTSRSIDEVIITMASASRTTIRRILEQCDRANVPVKIIPGLYEIIGDRVSINRLRSVQIEDLLGRDTIDVNAWLKDSRPDYVGKRVLVTGGAGSIGRELCRQLGGLDPAQIVLVDKDENSVFETIQDLGSLQKLHPVVCDLRFAIRLGQIFDRFRPHVVIHAAAYKHVPLMEMNEAEAVLNNIVGTEELLKCCARFQTERCVMVSTDKAVNPTSVMGATKRIAELMFQHQARKMNIHGSYSCVRFGNVLGSRGSVVSIFRQQITSGGPVTITHPDMTRYFMTIPEAAQLIIQAGALGRDGQIFLLDMGEPVKIVDLARDMITLSGLAPGVDIQIKVVGERPGEKLREELLIAEEGAQATRFKKIFIAAPMDYDFERLPIWIQALKEAAWIDDADRIVRTFAEMGIGFNITKPMSARAVSK